MNLSAIDLGTNTLRILIKSLDNKIKLKKNFYLFLGKEVLDGCLSQRGLNKLKESLVEVKRILEEYNVEKVFSVATAFARKINNINDLKDLFASILNCELNIIDSETEGLIVVKSIVNSFKADNFLVIDMGGGSTEFAIKSGSEIFVKSLNIGSLSLKNSFFKHDPPQSEEKKEFFSFILDNLNDLNIDYLNKIEKVFGVGGTITTIAFLLSGLKEYDPQKINGFSINRVALERFCHKIEFISSKELIEIFPIEQGREEVLLSGGLFLMTILHYLNFNSIIASDNSLLEGIIPFYIDSYIS